MNRKLYILGAMAGGAIITLIITGGPGSKPTRPQGAATSLSAPLNTASASSEVPERFVAAEGKVEVMPGYEVEVGSELEGLIASTYVAEGDVVKKGQVLAVIENRDLQARLGQAEAELAMARRRLEETLAGARPEELRRAEAEVEYARADRDFAKNELERGRRLVADKAISSVALEERELAHRRAEARVRAQEEGLGLLRAGARAETVALQREAVRQAEAAADVIRRVLEKSYIKSPIAGKVVRKYLQEGESISKELLLMAVADTSRIRVNAEVDEVDLGRIAKGDMVEILSDAYPGRVFEGVIEEIAGYIGARKIRPNNPARNVDMKVVQTRIRFKAQTPFLPGMTVDVRIKGKQR